MYDPVGGAGSGLDPPLTTLDEQGVARWFAQLGFPWYDQQIKEHGITGEILIHLDHEALKDVGIHSVGQRLAILKAVYALKVAQNVPVEEGHYVPPSDDMDHMMVDSPSAFMAPSQILDLLSERDERIRALENEVHRLHEGMLSLRDDNLRRTASNRAIRSPTNSNFPHANGQHPLSNASTLARSNSTSSPSLKPQNPSHQPSLPPNGVLPDIPRSPIESPRINGTAGPPPTTSGEAAQAATAISSAPQPSPSFSNPSNPSSQHHSSSTHQPQSQNHHLRPNGSGSSASGTSSGADLIPPFTSSGFGATTPTTPTGPVTNDPTAPSITTRSLSQSQGSTSSVAPSSNLLHPHASSSSLRTTSSPTPTASTSAAAGGTSSGSGQDSKQADNPYRSFRVTLEDPCWKVLPAALKKYKINDDWRMYALFICYGNTERCLSYDEKPLMLFQRLKENNSNPVFMLRHIKDIKSPITVASAKHAARKDRRPPNAGAGLDRPPLTDRQGGQLRLTRLHHPPVLLPVGKDRDKEAGKEGGGEDDQLAVDGGNSPDLGANGLPPPTSPREAPGYCISIYPYLADREDEFDVAVGDTFIIISKTKGWWVVHRDLGPGASDTTTRKSGWVPAGCLLETSVPPLSLPGALSSAGSPYNASNVSIEPSFIVSVSTPGIALMDYTKNGSDELDVKKGNHLRILKRYNHCE
ncbi:RA-domain-containing protein [Meredithblackwellia eburnea MCA 4105]